MDPDQIIDLFVAGIPDPAAATRAYMSELMALIKELGPSGFPVVVENSRELFGLMVVPEIQAAVSPSTAEQRLAASLILTDERLARLEALKKLTPPDAWGWLDDLDDRDEWPAKREYLSPD